MTFQPTEEDRAAAIAAWDDSDPEDWTESYQEGLMECGSREYFVLTDEEADHLAYENIERDLWAFVPRFLVNYMPDGIGVSHLEKIVESSYEDAAPAFRAMVGNRFDELVEDAISTDGRGHFIANYDGREDEFEYAGHTYYIYRQN